MLGALVFLLGLLLSIGFHELGHLLAAKASGARVSEYMIGFGPRVFQRRFGQTVYGLKLLPLGGYVKILGMHAPGKGVDAAETEAEQAVTGTDFHLLSVPRRTATLLAGVTANFILAAALLVTVISGIGLPQQSNEIAQVVPCLDAGCANPTPAAAADLRPGERIISIAGQPVADWETLVATMRALSPEDRVTVEVQGASGVRVVETTLAANPSDPSRPFLGLSPSVVTVREPPTQVPSILADQTGRVAGAILGFPVRVVEAFASSLTGEERDPEGAVGIVGVGRIGADLGSTEEVPLQVRLGQLLVLLAGLNVSLAVFNLIPLLPLDGGHVAVVLYEGARRRLARLRSAPDPGPVDMRRLMPLTNLVIVFFITASVLLLFADLLNPVTLP